MMSKTAIRLFYILCFAVLGHSGIAQTVRTDTIWYKRERHETLPYLAKFYELIVSNSNDSIIEKVRRVDIKSGMLMREYAVIKEYDGYIREKGPCTSYFSNGQIKEQYNSDGGNPRGAYTLYYDNGQKQSEGNYGDLGSYTRVGHWKFWYKNGQLQSEGNFEEGLSDGLHTFYYTNGQKRAEIDFAKGYEQGAVVYWDEEKKKHLVLLDDQLMWTMALKPAEKEKLKKTGKRVQQPYQADFDLSIYAMQRLKNGKNVLRFENASPAMICTIASDQMQGEYIRYFENGNLWQKGNFNNNLKEGLWKYYDSSGKLSYEVEYKDGKEHGSYKKYRRGILWDNTHYENGVKSGPYFTYKKQRDTSKGELFYEEGTYCQGKECSTIKRYYVDPASLNKAKLMEEFNIYPDSSQFEAIKYYQNGRVESITSSDKETPRMECIYFWPNGQIKFDVNYDNGSFPDTIRTYHANGQLEFEKVVSNTEVLTISQLDSDGNYIIQSGNGMILQKESDRIQLLHYRNGSFHLKEVFDEDSTLLSSTEYGGNFLPNAGGKVFYAGGEVNGRARQDGVQTYFNADGSMGSLWTFKNGEQHGLTSSYYESGQVKLESEWKYGKRDGKDVTYYPNGQIMAQSTYRDGQLHGETLYYDVNGKLEGKMIHFNGDKLEHIKY